jgi:hypothetical protein
MRFLIHSRENVVTASLEFLSSIPASLGIPRSRRTHALNLIGIAGEKEIGTDAGEFTWTRLEMHDPESSERQANHISEKPRKVPDAASW